MRVLPVLALSACVSVEPLDLPEDPAAAGAPVGVRTVEAEGETIEVWYPASEGTEGELDVVDFHDLVPQAFLDVTPELDIPTFTQQAYRDAPLRTLGATLPVVIFSHGFGGFRTQSVELTAHLASRGYVVVSADHPGRTVGDVVPCLITPSPAPCTISFGNFDDDPAVEDVGHVLDWLESGPDFLVEGDGLDLERIGIFGHSAGGGTTTAIANADTRIAAALPMAGAGTFERDLPSAVIGGSCDGIVGEADLVGSGDGASQGYFSLTAAGHLAFSDLCRADLGGLADQIAARPDANGLFLTGLRTLATDGCPGATPSASLETCDTFLDLDTSGPILRHAVTVFFDEHMLGSGPGLEAATFPELIRP